MKKIIFMSVFLMAVLCLNAKKSSKTDPGAKAKVETASLMFNVDGFIVDELTNETLAGAVIVFNGNQIYSDLDGNFKMKNIKPGKVSIKISMISYEDQTLEIDLGSTSSLNIKMKHV